jgi:agmatinase|tara:strand:- start:907 stop:1752 length:846 start_codon:yes stop_codon:yes gene_type:complete
LFTSHLTFANRPSELKDSKYAFLGIPFDSSQSYRVGSRYAPRAIREASIDLESYDMEEKTNLEDITISDLGNVDVSFGNFKQTNIRSTSVIKSILRKHTIPICVGGEHTISYSAISSYKKKPFIIIFDAHLDFRDEYLGEKFSHACVTRRIGELCGYNNILVIGTRSASKEELEDAESLGLKFIEFNNRVSQLKYISKITKDRDIYLSIDMDVLDPKEARGVGNPEPPGFSYRELVNSLEFLHESTLVGFDITEVIPSFDRYTPVLAAKIIFKILAKATRC